MTPFKLKANPFKQAGNFAKYEIFTSVNIKSLIFGLWLHAVSLLTNRNSEGILVLTFSVRKFVCHEISCCTVTLFLQIIRQSLGSWEKVGCFRMLKFSRTGSLSTDKCVTWMKMVSEVRTKASRCDVRKIICYMSTWSSTRGIRSALTNRSRNIALACDKHVCETNDQQHALHRPISRLKFCLKDVWYGMNTNRNFPLSMAASTHTVIFWVVTTFRHMCKLLSSPVSHYLEKEYRPVVEISNDKRNCCSRNVIPFWRDAVFSALGLLWFSATDFYITPNE